MWKPTIANVTLMALGSSAPEILLAIIETCGSLGEVAGELGPSTIVGSAAFNLLVITAVCIPSVQEPKKIFDTGVFITTAVFSVFAYLLLYAVLSLISPGEVQISEAWITLGFMIALVILAFGMDRWNAYKIKMSKNESDKLKDQYD
jgi:solute carrier family 8 (sodium/calcium exchanger)